MEQEKNKQQQAAQHASETAKKQTSNSESEIVVETPEPRKVSRTWEAAIRLKGSLIVNDPAFLL